MKKKGQIASYIFLSVLIFIVIVVAAVIAPFGVKLNTDLYAAGEDILYLANGSISDIDNATVRNEIYDVIGTGLDNTQDNIRVNTAFYKYSWIIVLAIAGMFFLLTSRQDVQGRSGGFV